ncbi:MAG: hypothetical protein COV72_05200 [Candidatus Omnitrophica bacterium CG11_big_fil_rev_8_21_14_0_20_42_13]|uniref:Ion-translocating oxidoreductase complex subunit G n=1 Tax=Candidatus Ghiorseimicrobium undicola TaxID=1974746 RepID=A0A2H0LX91_9BACT|nr:MAG: hypothetical protein COV72_05200 [Candidatus Omnitrophica bacterium CG11_big_fil_rev_8_21_14_0_20_42_13]
MNKDIIKFSLILFLICFIAAVFLSGSNFITKEKIAFQKQKEEQEALREVMPEAFSFEAVKNRANEVIFYKALDNNADKIIGCCFIASRYGYSSLIEIMVGMDTQGNIKGIKILSQAETPGLGAKIAELAVQTTLLEVLTGKAKKEEKSKPWFEERFSNKAINKLDKVETITGATISSRAVIEAVKEKAEEIVKIAASRE